MICPKCGTMNPNEAELCRRCASGLHPAHMKGKIPCYIHANREAVSTCNACGNRLCAACAISVNGIDYCDTCAPADAVRPVITDYEAIPVLDVERAARPNTYQKTMAFLIDTFLILVIGASIGLLSWAITTKYEWILSPRAGGWAFFLLWSLLILGGILYNAVAITLNGQTFGMKVTGVIVLRKDGYSLDWRSALIRAFGAVLSAAPLGLGFFWAFWDKDNDTWHDKLAQSRLFQYEEIS